jgi:hypothetical protein
MKKTCMLLALFMALAPGYVFSGPRPPEPPPLSKIPSLVGHWEGTGKFLDAPPAPANEDVEVTVSLDITEQTGTKFRGKILAYWMAEMDDRAHIGREVDIEVGGHIQGGSLPSTQSRTINMFGGIGWTERTGPNYTMEIDGQYLPAPPPGKSPVLVRTGPALICHWRGMDFNAPNDRLGYTGKPSVGDFTLHKTVPLVDE